MARRIQIARGPKARIGTLRRDHIRLPSEPGRGFSRGISRSNLSWRISRRRRLSSSRSAVVRPSARPPSSRSACATQLRIACADGSNSFASSLRTATGPNQLDHLPAELRRIRAVLLFRSWTPKTQKIGCPRKRGNFRFTQPALSAFSKVRAKKKHRLSTLGRMIVDPTQSREARAHAFLTVPLYKAIYEKFRGECCPQRLH